MMALRSSAAARPLARSAAVAALRPSSSRFASTAPAREDPKSRASSLISAVPGNSLVSKTGSIVLGTSVAALVISKELFVVNEEIVVGASFTILIAYLATLLRAPYSEWAEGQIQRFKDILNSSRRSHTEAVKARIDTVGEMKDVVGITESMFALSKETASLEHETFVAKQKSSLASEIKTTLDSWVRFEAQQRESEQADLVKSVQEKVLASLRDPKTQKQVLDQAVADIESLVKAGKI